MNNLKNYFFEDCGSIKSLTPYEIYEKGYNRAQLEYLEEQLAEAKQKAEQDYIDYQMSLYTLNNHGFPQLRSMKEDIRN